jgi:hypothetical protein
VQDEARKGPGNSQSRDDLKTATDRIAVMARRFLEAGRFGMALECAEETIDLAPDQLALEAIRAQAMCFSIAWTTPVRFFCNTAGARSEASSGKMAFSTTSRHIVRPDVPAP